MTSPRVIGSEAATSPRLEPDSEAPLRFNSYSGADIKVVVRITESDPDGDRELLIKEFAELQTISISTTRSVFPVRRLGESQPRVYTRGARTVAGSLVFSLFSRDAFVELYRQGAFQESDNPDEPFYVDQLPEFDALITMANEHGLVSHAIIGGITITNTGGTFSIHDVFTEQTMTYVARFYIPPMEDKKAMSILRKSFTAQLRSGSKAAADRLNKPTGTPTVTDNIIVDSGIRQVYF